MAILDRVETQEAIEAAKAEILVALAKTDGKLDVGVAAVKSVQHGVIDFGGKAEVSVAINPVNVDKSICLDNGSCSSYNGSRFHDLGVKLTLTNDSLIANTIAMSAVRTLSFSVIEFY